jgi:hypothetical protein
MPPRLTFEASIDNHRQVTHAYYDALETGSVPAGLSGKAIGGALWEAATSAPPNTEAAARLHELWRSCNSARRDVRKFVLMMDALLTWLAEYDGRRYQSPSFNIPLEQKDRWIGSDFAMKNSLTSIPPSSSVRPNGTSGLYPEIPPD